MADDDNDIFDPTRDAGKLAEDGRPPAAPADDIDASVPLDSPSTDDGIDSDELYQEGWRGATNADDEQIGPDRSVQPLDDYNS